MIDEVFKKHRDECDRKLRDGSLLAELEEVYSETLIGAPEPLEVSTALGNAIFAIQRLMDQLKCLKGYVNPSENACHALTLSSKHDQERVDFDTVDLSDEEYNAIWMRHIKPKVHGDAISGVV